MLRLNILFLIVGISFFGQAQGAVYSAKLEVIRLDSVGGPLEVNVDMEAMLVRDGQPIDPQPEYFYEWWREKPNVPGQQWELRNSGYGYNGYRAGTHCYFDSTLTEGLFDYYCRITIPPEQEAVTVVYSDTIRIPWWGVYANQKRTSGASYGTVKFWKDGAFVTNHVVPDTFLIPRYAAKVVLADTNLTADRLEKYQDWRDELSNERSWLNHNEFAPTEVFSHLASEFWNTRAATIRTNLIDGSVGGSVEFADPWLRDSSDQFGTLNRGLDPRFVQQGSPFTPNANVSGAGSEYKGVLLNQSVTGSTPYYRVNAPTTPLPGFTWYFLGWQADPDSAVLGSPGSAQSSVVFLEDGAVVSAKYKAHLRSSSTSVTATSGQRKVVRDLNGTYHMTYASGNEIWYTKSTDGTNWIQETMVSEGDPSYYNRAPSVTVQDNPHLVIVVWEGYLPDNTDRGVLARSINPVSGVLGPLESISSATGNFSTMPVVGAGIASTGSRYVLCAWFDGSDNKLKGSVRNTSGAWNGPTVIRSGAISEISVTPISPSSSYQNWGLAWTESGTLYYMGILVNSSITPGSVETVATGSEVVENRSPSVAHGVLPFSAPAIAWEEWHHELARRVIKYRERHKANGWSSTITTWQKVPGPSNYQTPSLSPNHQSQFNDVVLAWRSGTSQLVYTKRVMGVWNPVSSLATGLDPSISVGWTDPLQERLVHRGTSGPPYAIQRSAIVIPPPPNFARLSPTEGDMQGRGGKLIFNAGDVQLVVLQATLNGEALSFNTLPDTVRVRKIGEFLGFLQTGGFVGNGNLFLEMQYAGSGDIPPDLVTGIVLRDASTGELLSTLRSFSNTGDTVVTLTIPISWRERLVCLGLEPGGRIPVVREFELDRWFLVNEDSTTLFKPEIAGVNLKAETPGVPRDYALHPAYPNPFNPTTLIRYDLPVGSNVSITVYDILGKEVATLVESFETAGYHEAVFNASNIASGMYLYRMTAGSFTDTKKLIVLK
jgi:hypothetical protein